MTDLKIELPDYIKSALENIVRKKNVTNYQIVLSAGSKKGDNYMGEVYGVEVTGTNENGESVKLRLFLKIPPQNINRRQSINSHGAFIRETTFYNEILPIFQKFQAEKNLTSDVFDSYAACYAWSTTDLKEFLIMEDLRERNYVMFDKQKKLDVDHLKLALKQLAKFHALSFAAKDQKPELLDKFRLMSDTLLADAHVLDTVERIAISCVKMFIGEERHRKVLADAADIWRQKIVSCVDKDRAEPYAVLNHGDFWNNNLLFKYENGQLINVMILDWQIVRYASPALDILYCLFTCTDADFRAQHYEYLLRFYHESLSQFLIRLGSDPEKLFPYAALQDQLKKFGYFAIAMTMLVLPFIIAGNDDVPDIDELSDIAKADPAKRESMDVHSDRTKSVFTEKMTGIIQDLIKLEYLV